MGVPFVAVPGVISSPTTVLMVTGLVMVEVLIVGGRQTVPVVVGQEFGFL